MRIFDGNTYRDMTQEEMARREEERRRAAVEEATRPMTADEVQRLVLRRQVNALEIDDATASRMMDYYPTLDDYAEGTLISAGTAIHHGGALKRANVDLYNYPANSPDSAPTLWADIAYREGVRVIPATISAEQAFKLDELGWQNGHIYRSLMDGNVYPVTQADAWVMMR